MNIYGACTSKRSPSPTDSRAERTRPILKKDNQGNDIDLNETPSLEFYSFDWDKQINNRGIFAPKKYKNLGEWLRHSKNSDTILIRPSNTAYAKAISFYIAYNIKQNNQEQYDAQQKIIPISQTDLQKIIFTPELHNKILEMIDKIHEQYPNKKFTKFPDENIINSGLSVWDVMHPDTKKSK